jgi:hypothetical protein
LICESGAPGTKKRSFTGPYIAAYAPPIGDAAELAEPTAAVAAEPRRKERRSRIGT